ncbi:Uncharacterised protein [Mycobacteroides abscessus subsp. abscessus]|nr:Uncharacterised protein [Mycobacteroides abscessus subsp. abscessus]
MAHRENPATCAAVMVGGIDSSWRAVRTSTSAGPGWSKASERAPSNWSGRSTRSPWIPRAFATSANTGLSRPVP